MKAAVVSRAKGSCSSCFRGRGKGVSPVVLIKLALEADPMPYQWLGLCLVCAKAVAKEFSR